MQPLDSMMLAETWKHTDPEKEMNEYMGLCLAQAALARAHCAPNPAVGAVLIGHGGKIIGVGHTQQRGGPHAEIMAIQDALSKGHSLQGATAYVSLEPCSHQGRTGPCADALIHHGIKKVIASIVDPNPLVAGNGIARLRAAGIEVEVGLGADESRNLNIGFFSRMIRKIPWVRLKVAASLDGQIALENGTSKWITGASAREDGHRWRRQSSAIVTGIGTVEKDDPRLDIRMGDDVRQPPLVVVDSHLRLSPSAKIFNPNRPVFVYCAVSDDARRSALESKGAIVITKPGDSFLDRPQVDLKSMMQDLGNREINEVHIEAGSRLNGAFIESDLVDELILYLAPKMIGPGIPLAKFGAIESLSEASALEFQSFEKVGEDLRIVARFRGHASF